MNHTKALLLLTLILAVKTCIIAWIIVSGVIGLSPDEAQYWTWSKELALGYYSKPPGIAWEISLGTQLFGDTELGVRSMPLVLGCCLSFAVYFLAYCCKLPPLECFWVAVVMALTPLGFMSSYLAITDTGMTIMWTIALAFLASAMAKGKPPNYYAIGLAIAIGALFKWPIYLLWLGIIAAAIIYHRKFTIDIVYGVLLSTLGLLPSLIWNWQHDFVTFRHVEATIVGQHQLELGTTGLSRGNFFDFFGAQAALLSPIFFGAYLWACYHMFKDRKKENLSLVTIWAINTLLLVCYLLFSLKQKMQGNWCDFIYPALIVITCHVLFNASKKILISGVAVSLVLMAVAFSIPYLQAGYWQTSVAIPTHLNAFKHNVGWNHFDETLTLSGYDNEEHFLFSNRYQLASILSFYAPGQKRAYFFNTDNIRLNQFSFWPQMHDEQVGRIGYFIVSENVINANDAVDEIFIKKTENTLIPFFSTVEYIGSFPLFCFYENQEKIAYIFKCHNYNGNTLQTSFIY